MSFSRRLRVLLPFVALGIGCSERVVDSRAYNDEGLLAWSTVMPSSRNTALWLRYSVRGPVARQGTEDEGMIVYSLKGHLSLRGNKGHIYAGGIYLRPEGVTVDKVYSKGVRDGVERSCGYSTCSEVGRIMLMSLNEIAPGTVLDFEAKLPIEHEGAELLSANLELAPH
jgi:hypothetical protein